jgi:hypothetical protein
MTCQLPAIESQSWHPLEGETVRVGLYLARPRTQPRERERASADSIDPIEPPPARDER